MKANARFVPVALFVLAAAASLIPSDANSAPAQECSVVPPPVPTGFRAWDEDDNYNLTSVPIGGLVRLRISGDVIRINERNFQSLVRDIDKAIPNVEEIVFDGRKIIIDGSLSFETVRVAFMADEIAFGPSGQITLTAAPRAPGDGLRLVSRKISFDDTVSKPFQVETSTTPSRTVEVLTEVVVSNGANLTGTEAGLAIWNRTIGSYFEAMPPSAGWNVITDKTASALVTSVFQKEMFWPLYSAAKLDKFHARDPYSPKNKDALRGLIAEFKPRFEIWSSPMPLIALQRIEGLLRLDLDSLGKSAAFAPRVDINAQLAAVEKRVVESQTDAGYLSVLSGLVVAANQRKVVDQDALTQVLQRKDTNLATIITIQADIDAALARIDALKQNVASINMLITQRRATLATETASDVKREQEAAKVKVGTNVLAAGVAIGCMFIPGAQPAGIAIASGIQITGGLIYANNAGGLSTASIGEVISKGADFYAKMTAISASWEKFKTDTKTADTVLNGGVVLGGDPPKPGQSDIRMPLTKVEATKQWGAASSALAGAVDAAYKSLDIAKPTKLEGSDREKNDLELNELLSRTGAANKEASDLAASITAKADLLTITMADRYKAQEARAEILGASVVNDAEIERWKANSLALWNKYISDTLRDVLTLRRSYFFESGTFPNLPTDVLQYPEELLAFMRADLYDPTGGATSITPPDVLRAHLKTEKDKFFVSMKAIVTAISRGLQESLARRTQADVYRLTVSFRASSSKPIERRFVQTINSQIAQQIAFRQSGAAFAPLIIPLELPTAVSPFPERFVDAKVTKLVFRNKATILNQSGLTFTILHPGYGKIYRGNACFLFDLRELNSDNSIAKVTDLNAIDEQWAKQAAQKIDVSAPKNFYTYYPVRSPLSLATVVSGTNWTNPPEIEEIDIGLEVMQ